MPFLSRCVHIRHNGNNFSDSIKDNILFCAQRPQNSWNEQLERTCFAAVGTKQPAFSHIIAPWVLSEIRHERTKSRDDQASLSSISIIFWTFLHVWPQEREMIKPDKRCGLHYPIEVAWRGLYDIQLQPLASPAQRVGQVGQADEWARGNFSWPKPRWKRELSAT